MPTPPTLVANNGLAALGSSSARNFASITWLTGDIIIVAQVDEGAASESFATAPTVAGLTFTNLITHTSSSNCALAIWKATAASGGSGVVAGQPPTNGSSGAWNGWLWQWRGSSGIGNTATQFTSTKTVALSPAGGADSAIIWVSGDWAAGSSPAATPTTPNETTRQATVDSTLYTYVTADITDQTSAGSVSYGVNYTSAGPFSIAVVEIMGSTSSPVPILDLTNDAENQINSDVNFSVMQEADDFPALPPPDVGTSDNYQPVYTEYIWLGGDE